MDEYNSGMDPEVKRYFRKIINSFSMGLLWLLSIATAGLFFKLGIIYHKFLWYHAVFYILLAVSFILLIMYYYKLWNKKPE
jgi:hypothetical protein